MLPATTAAGKKRRSIYQCQRKSGGRRNIPNSVIPDRKNLGVENNSTSDGANIEQTSSEVNSQKWIVKEISRRTNVYRVGSNAKTVRLRYTKSAMPPMGRRREPEPKMVFGETLGGRILY